MLADRTGSQGTGIGLSLTKGLVTLLHGEIKVISEPREGTGFHVSFPLGKEHLSSDEFVILQVKPGDSENQTLMYSACRRRLA